MSRQNIERQSQLEPYRIEVAKESLEACGYKIINEDDTKIQFRYKYNVITLFPYSGWYTGKGIKDGRGLANLLKELK